MSLIRGRTKAGTSKILKKGAVASSDMKNGEEVLQYHNGRLKIIRKEFGKIFELEFSSPEQKELKTFAKHSDVKMPQRDAVKILNDGVRVGAGSGKKLFVKLAEDGDSVGSGETQIITTGINAGKILIP
jgi:hypothetical protein